MSKQDNDNSASTSKKKITTITPDTPGYKFLWLLKQRLVESDMTSSTLAEEIGISASTLSHIQTGRRSIPTMERESIEAIANWMGIPVLAAMLLAEQIKPSDFYTKSTLESDNINRAVRYILSDPDWGAFAPEEILDNENKQMQMYIIWCYEQATKTKLLSGSVDFSSLIDSLDKFQDERKTNTAKNA